METTMYDCQVWDSVTGEWGKISVEVASRNCSSYECLMVLAQSINEEVSVSTDEDRGAWILTDVHRMAVSGEEVIMAELRALASFDISLIVAVRT